MTIAVEQSQIGIRFVRFVPAGGGFLTADGDLNGLNSAPDYYLRLNQTGGVVGSGFVTPLFQDRFAIATFTVPQSGLYAVSDSFLSVFDQSDDGVELFVSVGDDAPIFAQPLIVAGGQPKAST